MLKGMKVEDEKVHRPYTFRLKNRLLSSCTAVPFTPYLPHLVPLDGVHVPLDVDDRGHAVLCHDLAELGVLVAGQLQHWRQTLV